MRKLFTLISVALVAMSMNAQTESYTAIDANGLAPEFTAVVSGGVATNVVDGKSVVKFATANVEAEAVGGTTPANNEGGEPGQQISADGVVAKWNDIKWDSKNQGDISFYFIQGTGNPYTKLAAEEIVTDGTPTGYYRALYTFYEADGTTGMPATGLYYKFTPKVAGKFKIAVWSNKGNRNTFVVDETTQKPIEYQVEGYINGQNAPEGGKKYLTNDEIVALRNPNNPTYVIGAGNQAFWGYVIFNAEAGKSYWLFQHSSQIGFGGFEFTPGSDTGISNLVVAGKTQKGARYNLAGQQVDASYKGMVIENGKKFVQK